MQANQIWHIYIYIYIYMHAKKRFITFTEYERIMNDSLNPCNKFIPIDHPYSLRTIRNHSHITAYSL